MIKDKAHVLHKSFHSLLNGFIPEVVSGRTSFLNSSVVRNEKGRLTVLNVPNQLSYHGSVL